MPPSTSRPARWFCRFRNRKRRIDQLGFALNVVSPIALIALSRTGLTNSALQSTLHTAEVGLMFRHDQGAMAYTVARDQATRNTSRTIAIAVIPLFP
jgi:hypothetical protein